MNSEKDGPLSPRIRVLREWARAPCDQRRYAQRQEIFARVFRENRSDPQVVRMAKGLAAFLREKEIILREEDLLAGNQQWYDFALPAMEDPPLSCPEGDLFLLAECRKGVRAGLFTFGLGGHVIAGYQRVLEKGFRSLAEAAGSRLAGNGRAGRDFARASLLVCEAATEYVQRYQARARELAQTAAGEERRQWMERIAEACQWVAANPPRSFFEAVQLLWLTHEIITCEQPSGSLSLGRVDQYLFPYYARDLAAGLLTPGEASELIEAFWVKLNGLSEGYQHVVLGGGSPDGGYAANDLSYICLRATRKVRMDQPLLSVRWHPGMPERFWEEIQELLQLGMGFPALFNDQMAMAAKQRLGIPQEEAQNYGVVGCVEIAIPGKEFSHTEGLRVNWAKVLDLMLNGGVCPVTGEALELKQKQELGTVASFEEFYQWYRKEFRHFLELGIRGLNLMDQVFPRQTPYPFLSSTMEGCLEKGEDVTAGSTVYNLSSVNGCGMANTADSLAAIRQMVYQEKKVSLPGLAAVLGCNFEGAGGLREALVTRCPKIGNDQEEVDGLLEELTEDFCGQVESCRNPRGGRFQAGLYTVNGHAHLGKLTGALPDGRRQGLALANGCSPAQGADTSGPTAVIRSIAKLDHSALGNGMVLDLKFHPAFFSDPRHRQAFKHLVETYFRLGGMEIQFNVISRETLLKAQQSPADYRDLLVRVSGFSAYFVRLDKTTQDEIIARTEHGKS